MVERCAALIEKQRPVPHSFATPWKAAVLSFALFVTSLCFDPTAAVAALPPDASGTWAIESFLRGQKCSATLMLQPMMAPQSAEETRRGAARYQGVCVEPADGSWLVQEGVGGSENGAPARLVWRLEYPRQQVFFAFDMEQKADGGLAGKGDVYAAQRSDPTTIKKVGDFSAKRVSKEWDMRNPVVGKIVTDKVLPERGLTTGIKYPF